MATTTANQEDQQARQSDLAPETIEFYREAMDALDEAGVPFLVGGAYAYARYTGIARHTKDFDVFVRPGDFDRALDAFARKGWQTERSFAHWLGKGLKGEDFVDVIFSSGNGVARVDEQWFDHAEEGEVLGRPVRLVPAEEMIWSKSFIMERERFDGADVSHVLHSRARQLDWDRLLRRFDKDGGWRVLLAHLTLFGYIYPGDAHLIPNRVMDDLAERLRQETREPSAASDAKLCRGTILSRSQYLIDVHRWGYQDARLQPAGNMTAREVEIWTTAAEKDGDATQLGVLKEG
ncbi:MAG TPA: nucleotidyltransferase [Thermoanaerobaculia bacterium]|jgi:hypothetical protein|nr:nucleotidyltransferase [Thermoanaerobaculia bacterium]